MISVAYVGNPDGNDTSSIRLEGRPNLVINGPPGDVTTAEYDFLTSLGYVLTVVGAGGTDPTPLSGDVTLSNGALVRKFDGAPVPSEYGGYAPSFVGGHNYRASQLISQGGQLWTRDAAGTSRSTFDSTEQAAWTARGASGSTAASGVSVTPDGSLTQTDVQAALMGLAGRSDSVESNSPTAGQKAALAGTSGTPGSGNRYVTANDPVLGGDGDPRLRGLARDMTSGDPVPTVQLVVEMVDGVFSDFSLEAIV